MKARTAKRNGMKAGLFLLPAACVLSGAGPATDGGIQLNPRAFPFVRETDERFQSFQIGMSHLTGGETWKTYDPSKKEGGNSQAKNFDAVREARAPTDLTNLRLRTLTAGLAPFYVRYGGTTTNSVYFVKPGEKVPTTPPDGFYTILTPAAWKGAIDFARAVDAKIVTGFTVSAGVRDANGGWTPRVAAPWLAYTKSIGGEIYAAELFNEPNAPEPGRVEKGQTASAFASDYAAFSAYMRSAAPKLKLAGPGVATLGVPLPMPKLEETSAEQYMSATPRPKVDIVSYHFYGAIAERCAPPTSPAGISADKALSEEWLARPDRQLQRFKALRDQYAPGAPLWLTETGAAACGGMRWQPTFLDAFRFVDSQARMAKQGLDVTVTHALISGSNGIIDEKTFLPNADYWPALLWAKFVGKKVLDAGPSPEGLHLYAHCQRRVKGGVTLLAINLEHNAKKITLPVGAQIYALTAQDLQSREVRLNGKPLALKNDRALPTLRPEKLSAGALTIAPSSVNFVVMPKAANPACSL